MREESEWGREKKMWAKWKKKKKKRKRKIFPFFVCYTHGKSLSITPLITFYPIIHTFTLPKPTHAHSLGIFYTRKSGKFNENCLCDFCPRWSPFSARSIRYEQEIVIFTHNQWCQFKGGAEEEDWRALKENFPRRKWQISG